MISSPTDCHDRRDRSPYIPTELTQELWIDFLATLARLLHPGQILEAARSAADGEQRPEHPVVGRQVSAARLLTEGGVEVQSALSSSFLLQVRRRCSRRGRRGEGGA